MNLSLKAKCSGCMALDMKQGTFVCSLGISILTDEFGAQPAPNHEKCYKPATTSELKQAKKLMKSTANVNA